MSAAIPQLSSFSSIDRRFQLHTKSNSCISLHSKVLVVLSHDAHRIGLSNSVTRTTVSYKTNTSVTLNKRLVKSYSTKDKHATGQDMSEQVHVPQQKRAAKIHDFCLGIPFGGFVLSEGLVGFIFSRNPTTLSTGVPFGGALLALSMISLKVWRQGKSSFPFILGQAVLAAALLWKNFQIYSSTRKLFPTGFYAIISAGMLCFYCYVVLSGGNPPPKKLRPSAAVSS